MKGNQQNQSSATPTTTTSSTSSSSSSSDFNRSQAMLNFEQVKRLISVVEESFEVNGRGNFPTIKICLRQLIKAVTKRMNEKDLKIKHVKMNGGAASHILASCNLPFSDIDLIFDVDFSSSPSTDFDLVKEVVMDALIEFLPDDINKDKITSSSIKDAYVRKMVKVSDGGDLWSLITLNNLRGRYVELKFVDRMRRQFEFSVDSFQIHLDSLMAFDDHRATPKFYPTVTAESVYGDFRVALKHLNEMLIDTVQPELIRGGGLLKYVQLLVRGYRPARPLREFRRMEKYMCSRFFIDFNTVDQQERKLRIHLDNHLQSDSLQTKYDFLLLLYQIVDESTVCLMNHERRLSLNLIERLAYEVEMELYYQDQMNAAVAAHAASAAQQAHHHQHYHRNVDQNQTAAAVGGGGGGGSSSSSTSSTTLQKKDESSSTPHQPKQTILFVPHNASYWIPVV